MYDLKSESVQDPKKRRSLPSQLTIVPNTAHIVSSDLFNIYNLYIFFSLLNYFFTILTIFRCYKMKLNLFSE